MRRCCTQRLCMLLLFTGKHKSRILSRVVPASACADSPAMLHPYVTHAAAVRTHTSPRAPLIYQIGPGAQLDLANMKSQVAPPEKKGGHSLRTNGDPNATSVRQAPAPNPRVQQRRPQRAEQNFGSGCLQQHRKRHRLLRYRHRQSSQGESC